MLDRVFEGRIKEFGQGKVRFNSNALDGKQQTGYTLCVCIVTQTSGPLDFEGSSGH